MKKWFVDNFEIVVPTVAVVAIVAMMVIGINPSEFVVSADWLVGGI